MSNEMSGTVGMLSLVNIRQFQQVFQQFMNEDEGEIDEEFFFGMEFVHCACCSLLTPIVH